MIEVREAVEAAEDFVREVMPEDELNFLRLEEIELDTEMNHWKVTLGWVTPEDRRRVETGWTSITGMPDKMPRTYKTFQVDAKTGEVLSMKVRDV